MIITEIAGVFVMLAIGWAALAVIMGMIGWIFGAPRRRREEREEKEKEIQRREMWRSRGII